MKWAHFSMLAGVALLTGCATAPVFSPPVLSVGIPEEWTGGDLAVGQVDVEWWNDFADVGLSAAVEMALSRNFDLQAAAARLEQAAADARAANAALHPTVQATYNGAQRKQNFVGFPIPGSEDEVLSTVSTNHGVSLDVSWEVDLWRRLRNASAATLAELEASAADLRAAQLSLAGQTTKSWLAIAEAQQQVDLSNESVESFRASAEQVRGRFEVGVRPALDLRLALLNLANAEALRQQRLQQLDATTRQLQVLLGVYASGSLETPQALPSVPAVVPAGLPADLVGRRPDLVSAERAVAAAGARVDVARADLLPRLSLTAATGTSTDGLRSLLDGSFGIWSLLGNVVQPIWQGGRLRAEVARTEARSAETLAVYANAALNAYAEVETALAAEDLHRRRVDHLTEATLQARAAERLAEERYFQGLDTYIPVLESLRSAVAAEGELIAARRLRLENRVDLYLALGGGFEQLELPIQLQNPDTGPNATTRTPVVEENAQEEE